MKTGFEENVKLSESKKFKNPWDFTQPTYDQRTSCFINAGTYHGVGKKAPIGTEGDPKGKSPIPMGKVKGLELYPNYEFLEE